MISKTEEERGRVGRARCKVGHCKSLDHERHPQPLIHYGGKAMTVQTKPIRPASYPNPADVPELAPLIAREQDTDFVAILEASLQQAKTIAQRDLKPALFNALKPWPTTIDEYLRFLVWFAHWIPQQSTDDAWLDPPDPDSDNPPNPPEYQEVYDRLCFFYWLIDQPDSDGNVVQDIPWFSEWLVEYAKVWGAFLDTIFSFSDEILQTFIDDSPEYRVQDSMIGDPPRSNNPSGWRTFNQFFARELNPGLRPITDPTDNTIVTAPADCTYKQYYTINDHSGIPDIKIKGTHTYANIKDLLVGSEYADSFANGFFIHFFLGPYSYHRFHTPVAGMVMECYPIQGKVYLKVVIGDHQFQANDASEGAYEFAQARGVITIDTSGSPFGDVGIVATIPVGMCQVSGVNMTHETGTECLKGDEFGYFTFGGSDIIVLFQEGTDPAYISEFVDNTTYYSLYGTEIAKLTLLSG